MSMKGASTGEDIVIKVVNATTSPIIKSPVVSIVVIRSYQ